MEDRSYGSSRSDRNRRPRSFGLDCFSRIKHLALLTFPLVRTYIVTVISGWRTGTVGEYGISQSIPRFEDPKLLTGGGDFIDDDNAHGQLMVLSSGHRMPMPISAGIDASAALASEGVVAVFTGRDYTDAGWGTIPHIGPPVKRRGGAISFCLISTRWQSTVCEWWARAWLS